MAKILANMQMYEWSMWWIKLRHRARFSPPMSVWGGGESMSTCKQPTRVFRCSIICKKWRCQSCIVGIISIWCVDKPMWVVGWQKWPLVSWSIQKGSCCCGYREPGGQDQWCTQRCGWVAHRCCQAWHPWRQQSLCLCCSCCEPSPLLITSCKSALKSPYTANQPALLSSPVRWKVISGP